jgi:hypothetical protein
VLLVRRVNQGVGDLLHDVIVGALTVVMALLVLRMSGLGHALPAAVEAVIAGGAGCAGALAYRRSPAVRGVVSYAAVLAPVVAAFFLFATPARGVLAPAGPAAEVAIAGDTPPVVIVIFDELPLSTLLGRDHLVDADAFPAFAGLASDATFFRNATASHSSTVEAVPALLSGRSIPVNTLPTAASHPTNLFSLLGGVYRPHALEPLTDLCAVKACGREEAGAGGNDAVTLLRDLGVLQLHLFLPDEWTGALPPVDAAWRDFGASETPALDRDAFLEQAVGVLREDTAGQFRQFVREIAPSARPGLHVLHTLLPHRPWRHLPDGRRHGGAGEPSLQPDGWTTREWPARQSLQLHLAQARFADVLLGELLTRLERAGLYDEAMVIVVADHGMSLLPGTPPRDVTAQTLAEIAPVPVFVKQPGQAEGAISDRPVETIDVMPTVLDVLGVDPPEGVEGASLLAADAPAREERHLVDAEGKRWQVGVDQTALFDAVRRKFQLVPRGGAGEQLFAMTPAGYARVLGRDMSEAVAPAPGLRLSLTRADAYRRVQLAAPVVPALVSGEIEGLATSDGVPALAVAVNDLVVAVTEADAGKGAGSFRALIPPTAFREGANEVEVFLIGADGGLRAIPPA